MEYERLVERVVVATRRDMDFSRFCMTADPSVLVELKQRIEAGEAVDFDCFDGSDYDNTDTDNDIERNDHEQAE
jgi:hypothetical protein